MLRGPTRSLAYHSGAVSAWHRIRNREFLTVVMFHRVLPKQEQLRVSADPAYAVTPDFLRACRAFFERHYNVVGLEDVLLSCRRAKPLPARPLLITFDDGWRDNAEWAEPALDGCPWTLFVATDAMRAGAIWWQEALLWALRSDPGSYDALLSGATRQGQAAADVHAALPRELQLLLAYSRLPLQRREEALAPYLKALSSRYLLPAMIGADELLRLHGRKVAIGAHSASHLPLTHVGNPKEDVARARDCLRELLPRAPIVAMSFPHGRWNSAVAESARTVGYELLFTSDPVLNPCPSGWLATDVIGRIPLGVAAAGNRLEMAAEPRLATWLFNRKRHCLERTRYA